jgi:hypothetical protein
MKLQDYIDRLYASGWDSPSDGQWTKIEAEFRILFPLDAALEDMEKERDHLLLQRDDLLSALEPFAVFACEVAPGEEPCSCHNCRAKLVIARCKEGA